jgi:hypothetical protein
MQEGVRTLEFSTFVLVVLPVRIRSIVPKMLTLISATPCKTPRSSVISLRWMLNVYMELTIKIVPYVRKDRIALIKKEIPFKLKSEIPWHSDAETPKYNPLETLSVLVFDDGKPQVYESWFIQEHIVQNFLGTGLDLIPANLDELLLSRSKSSQIAPVMQSALLSLRREEAS